MDRVREGGFHKEYLFSIYSLCSRSFTKVIKLLPWNARTTFSLQCNALTQSKQNRNVLREKIQLNQKLLEI